MALTLEQKEKLLKLEQEIQTKTLFDEKHKDRRNKTYIETGIPAEIVDMDLIKFGFALGLFRNKTEIRNGKPSILLDLVLGQTKNIDYSCIPHRFKLYPRRIKETEKIHMHNQHVNNKIKQHAALTERVISEELEKINKFIFMNIEHKESKLFITLCMETMNTILDDVLEENDEELVCVLRSALFLFVSFHEYKKMFKKQWHKNPSMVHRNNIDNTILNYPCVVSKMEKKQMLQSLVIKELNENVLNCYSFKEIYKNCCTPLLLYLPLKAILYYNVARFDSIGFLNITNVNTCWSFYVLKEIKNNIRVWVVDNTLHCFSVNLVKILLSYIVYLFRRHYSECFHTNHYLSKCWDKKINNAKIFINLFKHVLFLADYIKFNNFLTQTIKSKSIIIPTEYDVFDCFTYFPENVKIPDPKVMFSQIIMDIFENTITDDEIDKLFIFINQLTCE